MKRMGAVNKQADKEALKKELMELLAARDPRALKMIARIKKEAEKTNDTQLLGYAYYRYAYYYYFTNKDHRKFHHHLQTAIRHLLRNGDRESLACVYNLVAYEAQDYECYDIAYAYFMLALQTAEPLTGSALPGLLEANAGRLMTELGYPKEGRKQIRSAIKRFRPITSQNFYHYNMIFSYADEALASFLLKDKRGTERVLRNIEEHYEQAGKNERTLSEFYRVLPALFDALLAQDDAFIRKKMKPLCRLWRAMTPEDLTDVFVEVECLFSHMMSCGYEKEAKQLLDATKKTVCAENLTIARRYVSLQILYYESVNDTRRLRECLRKQHELQKRQMEEQVRMYRYATEFVESVQNIANEREHALREQEWLKRKANTDALTGLPNRNDMNHTLRILFDGAQEKKTPFAIGIMDVDRFKEFNDTFGHQTGDACLRWIGEVLKEFAADPHIYCARYGGDEFVLSFEGLRPQEIRRMAVRLQERIASRVIRTKSGLPSRDVRVSFGICCGTDASGQLWDFLSAADKALYRIKKKGGGKISLTTPRVK